MFGRESMRTRLKVIPTPEPGTRATIVSPSAPLIKGPGTDDYICGNCEKILIAGLPAGKSFKSTVLKCPVCGAFNETP
jgi:DNA-directed RNA polymerase subunit RPC12/RpoP